MASVVQAVAPRPIARPRHARSPRESPRLFVPRASSPAAIACPESKGTPRLRSGSTLSVISRADAPAWASFVATSHRFTALMETFAASAASIVRTAAEPGSPYNPARIADESRTIASANLIFLLRLAAALCDQLRGGRAARPKDSLHNGLRLQDCLTSRLEMDTIFVHAHRQTSFGRMPAARRIAGGRTMRPFSLMLVVSTLISHLSKIMSCPGEEMSF